MRFYKEIERRSASLRISMLFAEPAAILFGSQEDRVPAARWVCTLAVPAVLSAGHPHADDDVGTVASVASARTTPVFAT